MKKISKFLFAVVLIMVASSSSYGIDRETLWSRLEFSGSNSQHNETIKIAKQNLGLVEEILFLSDMQKYNGPARFNSLVVLRESCEEGLITQEHFFDVCLRLYGQINTIANPKRLESSKNQIKGQLANFAEQAHVPLPQQVSGFSSLSSSLFKASLIRNQGLLNSLNQKIANAQKSLEKRNPAAKSSAVNQIQATINELNAQRGNGIAEDAYLILSAYCRNLINKIQNSN
jgi:hypothetical protein